MARFLKPFKTRIDIRKTVMDYSLLTAGAIILAVNFDLFLAPYNIAPGGISGLAIIIHHFTGWLPGVTMFALTLPTLALGFYYLGRYRFLVRTSYVTIVVSLGVDILALFLPKGITGDLLLDALYGGILGGIGIGLIYRGGTAPAGTSVISRILNLKTGIPNSQAYLLIDGGIILAAGLVFGWELALYAFVTSFIWGLVADYVLEGPSVIRTAFIITDDPVTVAQALLEHMGIGVTAWAGKGMYTQKEHTTLFCAIKRPDVRIFSEIVNGADPRSFVVITQGHNALRGKLR